MSADRLAVEHMDAALRIARWACRDRPWLADEAESLSLVPLVETARSWDSSQGPYRRYLSTAIVRQVRSIPSWTTGRADDDDRPPDLQGLADPRTAREAEAERDAERAAARAARVRAALGRLRGMAGAVVRERYGFIRPSWPPLAVRYHTTPKLLARCEREGLARLREMLS